jgi:hypothetical protein
MWSRGRDNVIKCVVTIRNNIVVGTDDSFIEVVEYSESELYGKTLEELGRMLRIDFR